MVPPWQKYPEIPLGSIGWRMGRGEDHWIEFGGKTPAQKMRYAAENPEPRAWEGFYSRRGVTSE